MKIHETQDALHDVTADVFEINVDALRNRGGEFVSPARILVVDGGVEAKILHEPRAFFVRAGDSHDAATADFSNLANNAARGASGGRNHQRFALLGLSDFHAEESR